MVGLSRAVSNRTRRSPWRKPVVLGPSIEIHSSNDDITHLAGAKVRVETRRETMYLITRCWRYARSRRAPTAVRAPRRRCHHRRCRDGCVSTELIPRRCRRCGTRRNDLRGIARANRNAHKCHRGIRFSSRARSQKLSGPRVISSRSATAGNA